MIFIFMHFRLHLSCVVIRLSRCSAKLLQPVSRRPDKSSWDSYLHPQLQSLSSESTMAAEKATEMIYQPFKSILSYPASMDHPSAALFLAKLYSFYLTLGFSLVFLHSAQLMCRLIFALWPSRLALGRCRSLQLLSFRPWLAIMLFLFVIYILFYFVI